MSDKPGYMDLHTKRNTTAVPSVAVILVLLFLIWSAATAGFASLKATQVARSGQPQAADAAVRFSSRNAQNHLIRGVALQRQGDLQGAVAEYSQAVARRPNDYVLWLNLSHARELNGDREGAIVCARTAVGLAPHYARSHWQLGNLLVRAGRADEGFSELRIASASNPGLLPAFINLASQLSQGNVEYQVAATQPGNPEAYKALADFFRKRGQAKEAIDMFALAGPDAGDAIAQERRSYVAELLGAKKFHDAYRLWSIAHPPPDPEVPGLYDPGFERESDLDEPGFGWRAGETSDAIHLTLDGTQPHEGRRCLQVLFSGPSDPSQAVISQLVAVTPGKRYQLRFAVRTREVVSGGLPAVVVVDPENGQIVSQTETFPQTSDGWRNYTVDFSTAQTSEAIQIKLQRSTCASPCPAFGRVWLDDFSLRLVD